GWVVPIPTLIEMNELPENQRPKSSDPEFWNVWTNEVERKVIWKQISKEWQGENKNDKSNEKKENKGEEY
ncbi:MAG: hypothetical protein NC816_07125, partial [Candidatus Omnitrophica bacterium]|nr:hypothetical protein [Candidatus Omnitrophota bacterium]